MKLSVILQVTGLYLSLYNKLFKASLNRVNRVKANSFTLNP